MILILSNCNLSIFGEETVFKEKGGDMELLHVIMLEASTSETLTGKDPRRTSRFPQAFS